MSNQTINTRLGTAAHKIARGKVWVRTTYLPVDDYQALKPGDTLSHQDVVFNHLLSATIDINPGSNIIGVLNSSGSYDIIYPSGGGDPIKFVKVIAEGGSFPTAGGRRSYYAEEYGFSQNGLFGSPTIIDSFGGPSDVSFGLIPFDPQRFLYVINYRNNFVLEDSYWVVSKANGLWLLNNQATWMEDL